MEVLGLTELPNDSKGSDDKVASSILVAHGPRAEGDKVGGSVAESSEESIVDVAPLAAGKGDGIGDTEGERHLRHGPRF